MLLTMDDSISQVLKTLVTYHLLVFKNACVIVQKSNNKNCKIVKILKITYCDS